MTAALVLLCASGLTGARTLDQAPGYLKKEGNFVLVPASAMAGLGAVVGGVIALPAALVTAPIGWAAGDPLGYALLPVSVLGAAGGEAGYHIGGAIPWALKNGFYDAPMAGIARIKGEPPSGLVAQVDPPPAINAVDIQYLASTPEDARIPVVPPRQYSAALPPPKEPTSLMLKRALSPFKPPPGSIPATATPGSRPVIPPRLPAAAAVSPSLAPSAPAAVVPPPAVRAPEPRVQARSPEAPSRQAEPRPEPAVEDAPVDDSVEYERPSLKKKKRKFSERFSF
ncbi:MAG: hypothetical protein ACOY3X_06930 [Pseudomonadota bacterium]